MPARVHGLLALARDRAARAGAQRRGRELLVAGEDHLGREPQTGGGTGPGLGGEGEEGQIHRAAPGTRVAGGTGEPGENRSRVLHPDRLRAHAQLQIRAATLPASRFPRARHTPHPLDKIFTLRTRKRVILCGQAR
ncbi:hypothetical protein STTU_3406 [Streptomyces sp. Tu6071]|nr:hypothetical protein STTU_3406 [Streptomyces sp. Tu6071]